MLYMKDLGRSPLNPNYFMDMAVSRTRFWLAAVIGPTVD